MKFSHKANNKLSKPATKQGGYTILELLAVILIVVILLVLILWR